MAIQKSHIFCNEDARRLAKRRLPLLVFDFVDGATGREIGAQRNLDRFDAIQLQSRVLADVMDRSSTASLLGKEYDVPFGCAPMGMCNLIHPLSDRCLAQAARERNLPVCVSSAASTALEDMYELSGGNAWFQLYFGRSEEMTLQVVQRAKDAGYDTLVLTADVPVVSRRLRDLRNGFVMPFRLTRRNFFDFATHPRWSLSTLWNGIPSPMNLSADPANNDFDRNASRAGANWQFLEKLRDIWTGNLVVKGVTSADDAERIQTIGADAIYVSNHGGRQLDGQPASLDLLPKIRSAVKSDLPLIFDSGVRSGEDVIKALACGADFVMLGRPLLFALGAEGERGLNVLLDGITHDIAVVMAQLGIKAVSELGSSFIHDGRVNPE